MAEKAEKEVKVAGDGRWPDTLIGDNPVMKKNEATKEVIPKSDTPKEEGKKSDAP
jgi:hypothetical protein